MRLGVSVLFAILAIVATLYMWYLLISLAISAGIIWTIIGLWVLGHASLGIARALAEEANVR